IQYSRPLNLRILGKAEAGTPRQQMRARNNPGTAVFDGCLLQIEENREDRARPLQHIPMQVVASVPGQSQGGVIMAIGEEFDMGSEESFQRLENLRAGERLAKRSPPIPEVGYAYHPPLLVPHDRRDLLSDMLPDGFPDLRYGLGREMFRQFEKAVMTEKM